MKKISLLLFSAFISFSVLAQLPSNQYFTKEIPEKANKEFQFIGFYINQAVTSNIYPENDFLKGQTVGRLFGGNTTTTSNERTSAYVEQRLIPFFIYKPNLFNGKAILRAAFELDWTWGDVAYGVGGNFGGGFSADQVNLQTQNIELELNPAKGYYINLGLLRIFDTPYNPYTTTVDKMSITGYRLAYFGTDGVGISARKDWDFSRIKAGYYKLYENYIQLDDDVTLMELNGEKDVSRAWKVGGSAYYLRDRGNGAGGVSILGQGFNSLLANHNGTFRFNYGASPYRADVVWLGTFFNRNADTWLDPWTVSGFVNVNLGKADTLQLSTDEYAKATSIFGYAANGRVSYRYGQTSNDNITLDVLYTSGDANALKDGKYSGVITGNQWGAPGAIFISSGSYILMPHGNVVNRFTPAVMDISNMGYGMTYANLSVSRGFIPYKLNAKLGASVGQSNVIPEGGGSLIGAEVNGNIQYNFGPYMSLELHGAYLMLGDFYDSKQAAYGSAINGGVDTRPVNPWTAFLVFKWLMF
ncbi:MAG: hypothetical protein ACOX0M_05570 [Salinivirgaceae bacterium]|nr:hypothetical protein [Bacteroidales bacterium]